MALWFRLSGLHRVFLYGSQLCGTGDGHALNDHSGIYPKVTCPVCLQKLEEQPWLKKGPRS